MMRVKRFLILTVCLFSTYCGKSQTVKGQSEILVGIGALSVFDLTAHYEPFSFSRYAGSPIYALTYRYFLSKKISIGINLTHQDFDVAFLADNPRRYKHTHKETYTLITPEITYRYLDKELGKKKNELRLYGMVSIGCMLFSDIYDKGIYPGLQLTPVGARFGRNLAGYCELGFGGKGTVNAGLSYRFPGKK